jgi:hypothetical protein
MFLAVKEIKIKYLRLTMQRTVFLNIDTLLLLNLLLMTVLSIR